MQANPYSAPKATVDDRSGIQGSSVKAVLFGFLVDFGGSLVAGVLLSIIYAVILVESHADQGIIEKELSHVETLSAFGMVLSGAGLICSFFGGYVCALYSRRKVYRDAAILAAISVGSANLMLDDIYTDAEDVVLMVLTLLAIFLGAFSWRRSNR